MENLNKDNKIYYNSIKKDRLQKKIISKIDLIQKKINKNISISAKLVLQNKIEKLTRAYNLISKKPKDRNRYKETQIINARVIEYKNEIKTLNSFILSENIKIKKIKIKIHKLMRRKEKLDNEIVYKKNKRRSPALIRYNLRKHMLIEDIIS
jgi:hypothetical protein